jgi:hypothetical protein
VELANTSATVLSPFLERWRINWHGVAKTLGAFEQLCQ